MPSDMQLVINRRQYYFIWGFVSCVRTAGSMLRLSLAPAIVLSNLDNWMHLTRVLIRKQCQYAGMSLRGHSKLLAFTITFPYHLLLQKTGIIPESFQLANDNSSTFPNGTFAEGPKRPCQEQFYPQSNGSLILTTTARIKGVTLCTSKKPHGVKINPESPTMACLIIELIVVLDRKTA